VIPEFLFLNFQTREYWKQIHAGKSGSVQGGFNASKLGKLEIPLPPLAKQFEIIEAMAALQTVELKTIHSLKQLSVLRNSLLNKQLSSGITNV
jgi:type I restriction enzyme S subunit